MLEKKIKKKNQTVAHWSKKADKLMQVLAREMYADSGCLICNGQYSCVHHFINKSRSTHLRYNWINLIPICAKCHSSHHQGKNSTVHASIQLIKGEDWIKELMAEYKNGIGIKAGYTWYRNKYDELKKTI